MIVIGIDAHKQTHTAAVVQRTTGRVLASLTVSADDAGHRKLLDLGRVGGQERVWGV